MSNALTLLVELAIATRTAYFILFYICSQLSSCPDHTPVEPSHSSLPECMRVALDCWKLSVKTTHTSLQLSVFGNRVLVCLRICATKWEMERVCGIKDHVMMLDRYTPALMPFPPHSGMLRFSPPLNNFSE